MKKIILTVCTFLLATTLTFAQTTATNFTATDCNSNVHTLFTELDNGKIVVLVWIMPCGTCINDALGAYNAVQSFAASHPGKVIYYLIDDIGNANCATLSAWATTNGMDVSKIVIFNNTGNSIKESDYGGGGMPHVAVVGGTNHKIHINILDGANNEAAFKNAISAALSTNVSQFEKEKVIISVYPNPAKNHIAVQFALDKEEEITISIFNAIGSQVKSVIIPQTVGKLQTNINFDGTLSNGVYFLQLKTGERMKTVKFEVVN